MTEILKTKLYIPRPRPQLIPRPRLTERLNAGLHRRLTLVAAPAGFGKTSMLAAWIPQTPNCVTWLSLDAGDNDPNRFWVHVIASLRQVHPEFGVSARAMLESPQAPPMNSILTGLINDLSAFGEPFSAVLDDLHTVTAQPIHQGLAYLIEHLPPNLHLILSTRADPPLPLARLRASGELAELRAHDLRFTADEAAAFLAQAIGARLARAEIEALEARTEGWIAGLQIAALSMPAQEEVPAFIRTFSGSHRHILGYLAEEVLDRRPTGTLEFLLQTSILDRLCGPLCNAVTGRSDGQATLERLDQANLFITPLDDQGRWYRYHHLFAEVLQVRLHRSAPAQLAELHRRAGAWHAQHGTVQEAVRHSLASGDHDQAADLIEREAGGMLRGGATNSLAAWLEALPAQVVRSRPQLCLARAWAYQWGSPIDLARVEEWSSLALQAAQADGSLTPALAGEAAAVQAMAAATRSEVARTRELCQRALRDLPPDSPWRSAVTFTLGTVHLESSDVAAAGETMQEAIRLSQLDGARYIRLSAASFLGDILVSQGLLGRAQEMYQQVLTWAGPGTPHKGAAMAHGGLAHILCERGQLDAALEQISLGMGMVEHVGGAWAAFLLHREAARVQRIRGDLDGALETIERAYQAGVATRVNLVARQAAALRAALHLAQGNLGDAAAWAAESGLTPDDPELTHPGWRQSEYMALARVRSAQGDQAQAVRLLERLLEAAERQGRAGSSLSLRILLSIVLQARGQAERAQRALQRALTMAEPQGYLRSFVDEGEPVRELLSDLRSHLRPRAADLGSTAPRLLAYLDRLHAEFGGPHPAAGSATPAMPEPLTERELEILRLMSDGLTNQEIAAALVVAISTVKSHINHLYGKLGTSQRGQAVAAARQLGLLAD